MAILKFLGWRGLVGIGVALALLTLLLVQTIDKRHWKKQSAHFEQLYHAEQTAFAQTVANYRAAAEQARRDDAANAERVRRDQAAINKEREDAFEKRIADVRARAARLQQHAQGPADPGSRGGAPVPGVPAAAGGSAEATGEGRLPRSDALTATEQAIQLDELIKWSIRQHAVDPNKEPTDAR